MTTSGCDRNHRLPLGVSTGITERVRAFTHLDVSHYIEPEPTGSGGKGSADMTNLEHLNDLYGLAEDPWHMRGDWLAERRRDLVLASLHHARYTATFVPGCGSGRLLPDLAKRSEYLYGVDDNRDKLALARSRTEHLSNVEIGYRQLPVDWPMERRFDLIVLSEMGYLMDLADWAALAGSVRSSLTPDATVVASHRNHHFAGRQLGTDTLHGTLDSMLGLTRQTRVIDSEFAIDVWTNRDLVGS